jgi:hypothetical protein
MQWGGPGDGNRLSGLHERDVICGYGCLGLESKAGDLDWSNLAFEEWELGRESGRKSLMFSLDHFQQLDAVGTDIEFSGDLSFFSEVEDLLV